jgi:hypothetical protein
MQRCPSNSAANQDRYRDERAPVFAYGLLYDGSGIAKIRASGP